jgi:hypothetical protein
LKYFLVAAEPLLIASINSVLKLISGKDQILDNARLCRDGHWQQATDL